MNTMNQVKKSVFKNLEYFGPLWVIFSFLVVDPEFSYAGGKPPQGIQSRSYSTVEVKSPPILVPAPIVRQPKTEEEKENISKVKALIDEDQGMSHSIVNVQSPPVLTPAPIVRQPKTEE